MFFNRHNKLTKARLKAYAKLFGGSPSAVFPPHVLFKEPDESFEIDIFVYTLETDSGSVDVGVTNGMSDQRMAEPDYEHEWKRRELIQYFPKCTEDHARRLHEMAWLPLFDGFYLDSHHTIAWAYPAVECTPWKNAFFLPPLVASHRNFTFDIEGDRVSFLWHVPISEEEREFKNKYGADALVDRMEAINLPWVFDETKRPPLV